MRWLKHVLTVGLLLAAGAVALGTAFSDHNDDYGKVALPSGGVVHLPKGTTTVFYNRDGSDVEVQGSGLAFQVIPVAGGEPIEMSSAGGSISAEGTQRSEIVGEHGAIVKLKVPSAGDYRVVVAPGAVTATLDFGTNAATAVAAKWKLLAGLVLAAFLIALIPTPRRHRRRDESVSSTTSALPSSPSRAPYAG
jgi:hypothetical protein